LFAIVMASLVACNDITYKPLAVGREGVVTVVVDSSNWAGPVGVAIRAELEAPISTLPSPEAAFGIVRSAITSKTTLNQIKKSKNVVFVGSLSDSTVESRFLSSSFSPEAVTAIREGPGTMVPRTDVWRQRQQVVYVAANTRDNLVSTIREYGPEMRELFDAATRNRMEIEMFAKGRQDSLEQRLLDDHAFVLKVQHDYAFASDSEGFVWLRRILSAQSWRSLFVYYDDQVNPADLTPEWIVATRDSLSQHYMAGNVGGYVEVDQRRPITSENIDFLGRFAYETRGLWQTVGPDETGRIVQYGDGGPFLSYTFYDQDTGRVYMIDGMVFAPGFDKRDFLRQLEVIAHTFRSHSDVEGSERIVATAAGAK
jgi:hypothetical protein